MPDMRKSSVSSPLWMAPHVTIFLSSACIMVIELVAGRIIARHVGVSLYTWTAVIGVIMAGISLGNYYGGRIADTGRPRRILALLFFLTALGCALILPLNSLAGELGRFPGLPWSFRIFLHTLITFLAPSTALGMITPVVAKMGLEYHRAQGRTVGGIYACSVAGSLTGTFLAGFYLVMLWRASTLVLLSSAGMIFLGICYWVSVILYSDSPATADMPSLKQEPNSPYKTSASLWIYAALTVFVSNAAFMAFEFAVTRVISREFGSSLYTWTLVIGVVLGGITFGNYLGGRIADRSFSGRTIALLFGVSALLVLASPLCNEGVNILRGQNIHIATLSWPMQIALQVLAMCLIPCIAIGTVSPIVTKRLLASGVAPGASVGTVYAWGSIGSIFGTFFSGYLLVQWLGSLPLVALVATALSLVALCYLPRNLLTWAATLACVTALFSSLAFFPALRPVADLLKLSAASDPPAVYEKESQYSYIAIVKDRKEPAIHEMYLDQLVHTRIDMRDHTRLLYEYEWIYSEVMEKTHPTPSPVRAFVIGGGGYAYPHYLEITRPGSQITVAEIDPAVTEAAHVALDFPRNTAIRIEDRDARNVVDDLVRHQEADTSFHKFNYIFGDSINDYTVPYHLTTLEFNQRLHSLLEDDGVYLFNMIDMLDSGAFLAAVINTCRQTFEYVTVFNTGRQSFVRDTFVVVCSKKQLFLDDIPLRLQAQYAYIGKQLTDDLLDRLIVRHKKMVLTDDYAPVENLLAPVVRTRAGDTGEVNLAFARRYAENGDFVRALKRCRTAVSIHSKWPEAYELLAWLLQQSGDQEGSISALRQAIEGHEDPSSAWYALGQALMKSERYEEAIEAWTKCVEIKPDHINGLYNLGVLHGTRGELEQAIFFWRKVLELDPAHADSLHNLATAHVMGSELDEARKLVQQMKTLNLEVSPDIEKALK